MKVQFKESQSALDSEYQASRVIVGRAGGRGNKEESVVAAPNTAPDAKAA